MTDITLPNGEVITGVPEGTSKDEIMVKALQSGLANYQDFYPSESPVDVLGNRQQALGDFLTWPEKLGGGIRNVTSRVAGRINEAIQGGGNLAMPSTRGMYQEGPRELGMLGPEPAETERNIAEMSPGGGWETAGEIAATLPLARIPIGKGAQGYGQATALGGATGALTADDPAMGAALGTVMTPALMAGGDIAGRVAGSHLGKFAERTVKNADDYLANAMRRFQELGGRFTPGQARGGDMLRNAETGLSRVPLASSAYRGLYAQNQRRLTNIAAKSIGESADNLRPDVLNRASGNIGSKFESVARQIDRIPIDPTQAQYLPSAGPPQMTAKFADYFNKGYLTGREYLNIRNTSKGLGKIAKGNSDKADAASTMLDYLDEQMGAVASDSTKALYRTAREQWKNLVSLTRGKAISSGQINHQSLQGNLVRNYDNSYIMDRGTVLPDTQDLFDFVRVMADERTSMAFPSPGTAETLMWGGLGAGSIVPGGAEALAPLAGAAYVAPRTILGAPSEAARAAGALTGRTVPLLTNE